MFEDNSDKDISIPSIPILNFTNQLVELTEL